MNNDDQKIVWNKGNASDTKADSAQESGSEPLLGDETLSDLAQRAGDYKTNLQNPDEPEDAIIDIKDDIKNLLGDVEQQLDGTETPEPDVLSASNNDLVENSEKSAPAKGEKTDSTPGSPAVAAALAASAAKNQEKTDTDKEASDSDSGNEIDSLKESIQKDLEQKPVQDLDENTKKLLEEKEKNKGVEQTYYSDISTAMGSNEPRTMSELLRKASFEKKEKEIFSPRSKKNIAYIVGTVVLIGLIIGTIVSFFGKKEVVQYITEKKVESLVYSDLDTGINSVGIETEKTKQAIRKVVETKLAEDTIHQIYYVGEDKFGNLRRLGIRQVFELTDNLPPDLLYENVENQFMHGVYKTDKNHPFIILKALSYDRAFEGMKEWEPTMIDDLATYLDLPPEAGDRSLLEPGFSDDLIKNKTVRVARFLPREVDRRGIFGIFNSSDEQDSGDVVSFLKEQVKSFVFNTALPVFAQSFLNEDGGTNDIGQSGTVGSNGNIVESGNAIDGSIPDEREVCFDVETGAKVRDEDNVPSDQQFCFETFQCKTYECTLNGQAVSPDREGEPGVSCGEKTLLSCRSETPGEVGSPLLCQRNINGLIENQDWAGKKSCKTFPELLTLQNLNTKQICFDTQGNYIESVPTDGNGRILSGYNCISPVNRDATMCLDINNKIVFKDPLLPESAYQFCVKPLRGSTRLVDEQFQQNYGELQEKALVIGL